METARTNANTDAARVEWPTLLLIVATIATWVLLTLYWKEIPLLVLLPAAACCLALYGSLQHEVIHGHPTASEGVNLTLVWMPLTLWMPLSVYASTHRAHHRAELTHPRDDSESWYIAEHEWLRMGRLTRLVLRFNNTFAGRMILGPWISIQRCWRNQFRQLLHDGSNVVMLAGHALGIALVLGWVTLLADMPIVVYLLVFVWPAISLGLMRSFVEHRHDADPEHRTAIVEGCPLTRLLFLNNNYHVVHHQHPGLPWYRIPQAYRRDATAIADANGGLRYPGYARIAWRYLFTPCAEPVYPMAVADPGRP